MGRQVGRRAGLAGGERNGRDETEAFADDQVKVGQAVWIWKVFLAGVACWIGQRWYLLPDLFSQFIRTFGC